MIYDFFRKIFHKFVLRENEDLDEVESNIDDSADEIEFEIGVEAIIDSKI